MIESMKDELTYWVESNHHIRLFLINGDVVDLSPPLTDIMDWCIHSVKKSNGIYIPFESIVYFQIR